MKRLMYATLLMMTLLSACAGAPANTTLEPVQTDIPVQTEAPALPTDTAAPAVPSDTAQAPAEPPTNPKLPAASFDAETYINEEAGFALDYPAGWTVNEMVVGSRGTQVQFLSSPELAEAATVPEGATRVTAMIYDWDPKNDLAAYLANQKSAWEASGFTVIEEEELILDLGLPAVRLTVQTPDVPVVFLITALRDRYLVLSGEGDMALVNEIVGRVRPISP